MRSTVHSAVVLSVSEIFLFLSDYLLYSLAFLDIIILSFYYIIILFFSLGIRFEWKPSGMLERTLPASPLATGDSH